MASDRDFVAFVCEQLRGAGDLSSRRMFGEAAVYLGNKVVGLVCDNQLFIKPTAPGRARLGVATEAPPFPGATNWFLLSDLDDPEFLVELVRATAAALPEPTVKPKAKTTKATTNERAEKQAIKKKAAKQRAKKAAKQRAKTAAKQVATSVHRRRRYA